MIQCSLLAVLLSHQGDHTHQTNIKNKLTSTDQTGTRNNSNLMRRAAGSRAEDRPTGLRVLGLTGVRMCVCQDNQVCVGGGPVS